GGGGRGAATSGFDRDGSAQGLQSGAGRSGVETLRQHSAPPGRLPGRYGLNATYSFAHGGPLATCIMRASRSMRTAPTVIACDATPRRGTFEFSKPLHRM